MAKKPSQTSPILDDLKMPKIYLWLLIVSVILFVPVYIPWVVGWSNDSFLAFLHDLGASGLVAFVLILTVEKVSKDRMRREAADRDHQRALEVRKATDDIKENLFRAIYNRYVPEELFAQVEKVMFEEPVYRTNYSVSYYIENFKGDALNGLTKELVQKYVQCTAASEYTLTNTSSQPIRYQSKTHLELPLDNDLHRFVKVRSFTVGHTSLSEEEITQAEVDDPKGIHYKFEHVVELLPGESVKMSMASRMIKRNEDQEVWASRIPSDGMRLSVQSPDGILVEATANHLDELRQIPEAIPKTKHWELNSAIFPFQSVIFWWTIPPEIDVDTTENN